MTIVRRHTRRVNGHTSNVVKHNREVSGKAGEFARNNNHSSERHKLLLHGIKLHKESQKLFNAGDYESAGFKRSQANNILDGFSEQEVNHAFKLFN